MAPYMTILLLFLCLSLTFSINCVSPDGAFRNWWLMYKIPVLPNSGKFQNGLGYAYLDEFASMSIASDNLSDLSNPLAQTLQKIYKNSSQDYIFWNDEPPSGDKSSKYGHSKGVISWDNKKSIYILHSIPRFPLDPKTQYQYTFPQNEILYGQHILCISVSNSNANSILGALQYVRPHVYSSRASDTSQVPNANPLISGSYHPTGSTTQDLGTWRYFSKSSGWGEDFWEDLIEPQYFSGFLVETWRRSPTLPTYCTPQKSYDSINVCSISFANSDASWPYTKDHSKWGISIDKNTICFADINRMTSQRSRGGGALCRTNSPLLAQQMNNLIASHDSCSTPSQTTCPH